MIVRAASWCTCRGTASTRSPLARNPVTIASIRIDGDQSGTARLGCCVQTQMTLKRITLLLAATMVVSACGIEDDPGLGLPEDPDAPVLQIRSEGGFAPVTMILGRGPLYTLLADGRLIYEGPTMAIYPGPLVPNYQVARITDEEMVHVMELIESIGLPEMDWEIDERAASRVADATTEVVTYWDGNGEHSYAVYALGIDLDEPQPPATVAFRELFGLMGELTASEAEPYTSERVQIVAGPGTVDEEFEDVRAWPLEDADLAAWDSFPNGWMCKTFGHGVLAEFTDATQSTVWKHPDPDHPNSLVTLLVRPLHPGEEPCPTP